VEVGDAHVALGDRQAGDASHRADRVAAAGAGRVRDGHAVLDREVQVAEARACRAQLRVQLAAKMMDTGIDVWVSPAAAGPAPRGLDSTGDPAMNLPWTFAGLPAVTVPAGRASNGLPLGFQIVAPANADEQLLAWAEQIAAMLVETRHG